MEKLLTLKELAENLGMKYSATMYFVNANPDFPRIRTGRKLNRAMFRLSSVQKWMADYEVRCTQDNIYKAVNQKG